MNPNPPAPAGWKRPSGTPINILETAKNLIVPSGLVSGRDAMPGGHRTTRHREVRCRVSIPIQITGLRPGEKLHEVLRQ